MATSRIKPSSVAGARPPPRPARAPRPGDLTVPSVTKPADSFGVVSPTAPGAVPASGPHDPLAGLSDGVRKLIISRFDALTRGFIGTSTLQKLAGAPGFAQLDVATQMRLVHLVGGTNDEISREAGFKAHFLLVSAPFVAASPSTQGALLEQYMADQAWLRTGTFIRTGGTTGAPFTLTGPTALPSFRFEGVAAKTLAWEIKIDGRTIPVRIGQNRDASLAYHSIHEIAQGLSMLPSASRGLVTAIHAPGVRNAGDAFWAQRFKDPSYRAYMTAGAEGVISIFPTLEPMEQKDLNSSLVHETGHTLSKRNWGESSGSAAWRRWSAAAASDGLHVSRYAQKSVDEDFSETFEVYNQVKGTSVEGELRALLPGRFALIDGLLASPPR